MAHQAPHSSIRVAARLANGFLLDLARLGGFGRDVIDGLLIMAISQSNVAQITRSPELQRTYAALDEVPPDDLRRPVSISAVANSLRIPFETARRRVTALAQLGVVDIQPRGVIVPQRAVNSPFYRLGAEAHCNLVRTLYFRLRGIGLLTDLARPNAPPLDPERPPLRLVMRLSSDYLLRLAEPISQHLGDLVTGLILMDTIQANTEHLPDTEGGAEGDDSWAPDGFVDDRLRKPVRAATLSQRLGIPQETVRRHLERLTKHDRCERRDDGFVVPSRALAGPVFVQFMVDNQSHLHRLYAGLADFGVLSQWEHEALHLRGAA